MKVSVIYFQCFVGDIFDWTVFCFQLKLANQMNTICFNLVVNIFTSNFEFQFSVSVLSLWRICNWKMEFGHNIYFVIITIYSQWLLCFYLGHFIVFHKTNFLVNTAGLHELGRLDMWCCYASQCHITELYFVKLQTLKILMCHFSALT